MSLTVETSPPISPIVIPRLSEAETQRANTLIGTHRIFAFSWAGKAAQFRFTSVEAAPSPTGWIRARLDDHSFEVGLPALPEPTLLGDAFAGIEIAALPEELIGGVLEAWLGDAVQALKQQSIALQLEAWRAEQRIVEADFGWEISWDGRERFLAGTISGSPEALSYLAGLAHRSAPKPRTSADSLSYPAVAAVATTQLQWAMLRGLDAGDVVLVPQSKADIAAGRCELWVAGRRVALGRREGSRVTISKMNASTETKTSASAAGGVRVDDLPVQLLFEVGQVDVTVSQLRTLGEGFTFELPAALERLVTIRANGREVGQGELVEVGDKMGVRIVNWSVS